MSLFGERFDRKEKHVFVNQHEDITTGKQVQNKVAGRIKGDQLTKRKITQQNLYRKYRGDGMGFIEAYKKAKADASSIMLKQTTQKSHHDNRYHDKKQYRHHNKHYFHHHRH